MGKVNKRTSNCDCWLERLPKVSLNVNSSQQYPYILYRYKTQKRLNKENTRLLFVFVSLNGQYARLLKNPKFYQIKGLCIILYLKRLKF